MNICPYIYFQLDLGGGPIRHDDDDKVIMSLNFMGCISCLLKKAHLHFSCHFLNQNLTLS